MRVAIVHSFKINSKLVWKFLFIIFFFCLLIIVVVISSQRTGTLAITPERSKTRKRCPNLVTLNYLTQLRLYVAVPILLEDTRTQHLVTLIHDTWHPEMSFKKFNSLYSSVLDITLLIRLEFGPLPILKLFDKVQYEKRVYKVYKCVSHICLVLEVNWQVQEVVLTHVVLVQLCQKR